MVAFVLPKSIFSVSGQKLSCTCAACVVQGKIFYGNVVTKAIYWDEEADEKFEVKQPESKKQRQEE